MVQQSVGIAKFKRASIPYIATEVEEILKHAPGNTPKPPPRRKPRRDMKLELADAEISRCQWCGNWTLNTHCSHCTEHGYPTIQDWKD